MAIMDVVVASYIGCLIALVSYDAFKEMLFGKDDE